MQKLWVYIKNDENIEKINEIIFNIKEKRNLDLYIYKDSYRDFIHYNKMKRDIQENQGILVISSIKDIAHNTEDIIKELTWFKEQKLEVIFVDYPTTYSIDNKATNEISLNVLIDVYSQLQKNKTFDIKDQQFKNKTVGRKKIDYPDNWDELYQKWISNEITAKKFMESTGLKRGTFYHLANAYKEQLKNNEILKEVN